MKRRMRIDLRLLDAYLDIVADYCDISATATAIVIAFATAFASPTTICA